MNTIPSIKSTFAALSAALLLNFTAQALPATDAQPVQAELNRHPLMAKIAGAFDKLDLDPAQRDQIKAILKSNLPSLKPLIQQCVAEHRALTDTIQTVPVNETAIRAQSAKVAGIDTELAVQRARLSSQIQAVLRPDQIAEFQKMKIGLRDKLDQHRSHAGQILNGQ